MARPRKYRGGPARTDTPFAMVCGPRLKLSNQGCCTENPVGHCSTVGLSCMGELRIAAMAFVLTRSPGPHSPQDARLALCEVRYVPFRQRPASALVVSDMTWPTHTYESINLPQEKSRHGTCSCSICRVHACFLASSTRCIIHPAAQPHILADTPAPSSLATGPGRWVSRDRHTHTQTNKKKLWRAGAQEPSHRQHLQLVQAQDGLRHHLKHKARDDMGNIHAFLPPMAAGGTAAPTA